MKKIGFFGGSFDPIHYGHLNLAIELQEAHHLDEVWFCPAKANPLKKQGPQATKEHRKEMVSIAIEEIPSFSLITDEINRQTPSYTIETLRNLQKQYADIELYLILGQDAITSFYQWFEAEKVIEIASPLIGVRNGETTYDIQGSFAIKQALLKGFTITRSLEISATDIRNRLKKGLYCGHLAPRKVIDYIYRNGLYFSK